MCTCRDVQDDSDVSDVNDALLKTSRQGNPTLKLYCVCTDSRKDFGNFSLSHSYECGGRYMTCSEKITTVRLILSQQNEGHALNMTVEWVAFLIRIR
jgi:hypothetical protein